MKIINHALASAFQEGLGATGKATGHIPESGEFTSLPTTIGKVIGILLALIGVVFLALIIYGGYIWMTAHGNEQQVDKAKNTIKNSLIGLILVLAAYAITAFLGNVI